MAMGDAVAPTWAFATDLTLGCHGATPSIFTLIDAQCQWINCYQALSEPVKSPTNPVNAEKD